MSPVQMMATATSAGAHGGGGSSSSQSHNASPVFARKLSRPMEYLLGGQQNNSSGGNGDNVNGGNSDFMADPHYSVGLSSGNYTSFCTSGSEPISFATSSTSGVGSGMPSATTTNTTTATSPGGNGNMNNNLNCGGGEGGGFPGSDCCEILQITEDYDEEDVVARKDSLEENEERSRSNSKQVMLNGDSRNSGRNGVQPQFLVGGDIMQPDLNVPNEVFGPVSHAEILNRNNIHHQPHNNNVMNNANLNNSQHSSPTGRQGITHNNKQGTKNKYEKYII